MQIGMIGGMVGGVILLMWGILQAGGTIGMFVDLPSLIITCGGTIASMLVSHPLRSLALWPTLFRIAIFPPSHNLNEIIITLVSFSEKARREGLLALEDDLEDLDDKFTRKGLQLVVDGTDPELVKNIMENEIDQMAARHDDNKRMFDDASSLAPAFGMIGTLMGLVMMLVNLSDRSSVGPYLAVAILTTFYGAVLCYLVFTPMGTRLDMMTGHEMLTKSIILMGILSIQSGDNPRIVKDKLVSFLPESIREQISEEVGD